MGNNTEQRLPLAIEGKDHLSSEQLAYGSGSPHGHCGGMGPLTSGEDSNWLLYFTIGSAQPKDAQDKRRMAQGWHWAALNVSVNEVYIICS